MKKIVAFSVLLVLLSAAVFAQDDSGWKIGFTAQLARSFFFASKATGKTEVSNSGSPTVTGELGKYTKGSSDVFTYTDSGRRPDNRLLLSLSNNGEHHSVYLDIAWDNGWIGSGVSFYNFITKGSADWWFSGDTGASGGAVVFDAKVGTGRYGGFVPVYEFWDDYLQLGEHNFFGVYQYDGFKTSNNISGTSMDLDNPWDSVYALGATFGGKFKFALGSTLGSFSAGIDNPYGSYSNIEAGFLLSGKELGPLTFDVFYAVKGKDENTAIRGDGTLNSGYWDNTLGFYAGIDGEKIGVKGLGLSAGYTASFLKRETAQQLKDVADPAKGYAAYEVIDPFWSGIDIKVNFTGIEKMGITFNNNISFAAVEGAEYKKPGDKRVVDFSGNYLGKDSKNGWFVYDVILGVNYSLSPNLNATFALGNKLSVFSTELKDSYNFIGVTYSSEDKNTYTEDELRISLHADYSVNNITFGIGLNLGLVSTISEKEGKFSSFGPGVNNSSSTKSKDELNIVRFGVPLFFKVSL